MTLIEDHLLAIEAGARGGALDAAVALELCAEVRRLRALPVVRRCDQCRSYAVTKGGTHAECARTREYLGDPERSIVPPARCPLRAVRP